MTPRKGDPVTVTFEAEYVSGDALGHRIIWRPAHPCPPELVGYRIPCDATVEVIEDLQADDVVRDDRGWILCRSRTGGWFAFGESGQYADDAAIRPLTLLLRDGKPVTP